MTFLCRAPLAAAILLAAGCLAYGADTLTPGRTLAAHVIDAPDTPLQLDMDAGTAADLRIEQREGHRRRDTFEGEASRQ